VNVTISSIEDFGSDRYTYLRGDDSRYQTGQVITLTPGDAETNEAFERRMDEMCRQLLGMQGIASVTVDLDRSRGAIVQAVVSVVEAPTPAPIQADRRPAGGRFNGPRGARGGRR